MRAAEERAGKPTANNLSARAEVGTFKENGPSDVLYS